MCVCALFRLWVDLPQLQTLAATNTKHRFVLLDFNHDAQNTIKIVCLQVVFCWEAEKEFQTKGYSAN